MNAPNYMLLRQLRDNGTMKGATCAMSSLDQVQRALEARKDRAIFDMGEGVLPGRYWTVEPCDIDALSAAGYRMLHAPGGDEPSALADAAGDDVS